MQHFLEQLCEPSFGIQLAYLVDILNQLYQLNLHCQGSGNEHFDGAGNIFCIQGQTLCAFVLH